MKALDAALDALPDGGGEAVVATPEGSVVVDVVEVDRLAARIRGIRAFGPPVDAVAEFERLTQQRALPQLRPVEVEPRLGGGTLRSDSDDEGWYELTVRPEGTAIGRYRGGAEGREAETWAITRRELGRWVDAIRRT